MRLSARQGETLEMISYYGGMSPNWFHPATIKSLKGHKLIVEKKCKRKSNPFGVRWHLTELGRAAVAGYKAGKNAKSKR